MRWGFTEMIKILTCSALLFGALGVSTLATGSDSKWQWAVSPYLWAADMEISVKDQGTTIGGSQADFKDLVDKTEFGFQLIAEGGPKGGKWSVFTDVTYIEIADDAIVDTVSVDLDTDALFLDIGGVYSPAGIGKGIHVLGGCAT